MELWPNPDQHVVLSNKTGQIEDSCIEEIFPDIEEERKKGTVIQDNEHQ